MTAENIIGFGIYIFVALIMLGIGICQYRSKEPVGFYSGEEPPNQEALTDVEAWNKKHGTMWIIYGIIIIISYPIGMLIGDTVWSVVPMCGGMIIPIIFMIKYHNKLIKQYMK
ncbi:MAG: hypothetical protein E7262_04470 [Lachnospiraceae bacterium]|nr:hypothetical protein [Lachnospiraceae bacterium]